MKPRMILTIIFLLRSLLAFGATQYVDEDLKYLDSNLFSKTKKISKKVEKKNKETKNPKISETKTEAVQTPRYNDIQDIESLYFDTVKTKASALKKKKRRIK